MNDMYLTKLISSFVIGDGALSNLKHYGKGKGNYEINKVKNSHYYIKQLSIHKPMQRKTRPGAHSRSGNKTRTP